MKKIIAASSAPDYCDFCTLHRPVAKTYPCQDFLMGSLFNLKGEPSPVTEWIEHPGTVPEVQQMVAEMERQGMGESLCESWSYGVWNACQSCAHLVDREDWDGLVNRMNRIVPQHLPPSEHVDLDYIQNLNRSNVRQFAQCRIKGEN